MAPQPPRTHKPNLGKAHHPPSSSPSTTSSTSQSSPLTLPTRSSPLSPWTPTRSNSTRRRDVNSSAHTVRSGRGKGVSPQPRRGSTPSQVSRRERMRVRCGGCKLPFEHLFTGGAPPEALAEGKLGVGDGKMVLEEGEKGVDEMYSDEESEVCECEEKERREREGRWNRWVEGEDVMADLTDDYVKGGRQESAKEKEAGVEEEVLMEWLLERSEAGYV